MKETRILVVGDDCSYPISQFTFWNKGKQAVRCYEEDDEKIIEVYSEPDWKIVEEEIPINNESWEDFKLRTKNLEDYQKWVDSNYIYDETYKKMSYDAEDFAKKYNSVNKIELDIEEDPYAILKCEGAKFFHKIRIKYEKQIREGNPVNEFEFEEYGFITQELIDTCLRSKDFDQKKQKFYKDNLKTN